MMAGEIEALERRVAEPRFVYSVGYSLERLHSGVLAQLLRGPHGPSLFTKLWKLASDGEDIEENRIVSLTPEREVKLGHRCVVDMTILAKFYDGSFFRIIAEYKVDGTTDHAGQCKRIVDSVGGDSSRNAGTRTCFALITPGGAEFWDTPEDFRKISVLDLRALLENITNIQMVDDYKSALQDEIWRRNLAPAMIAHPSDEQVRLGYRRYDLWYAYYGRVRDYMDQPEEWSIYTGGHNPVMNWQPAWQDAVQGKNDLGWGRLYCEMNYGEFCLKVHHVSTPVQNTFNQVLSSMSQELLSKGIETHTRRLTRRGIQTTTWGTLGLQGSAHEPQTVAAAIEHFVHSDFLKICDAIKSCVKQAES